jgi:hypothetical protein
MSISEERMMILKMVEEGKVSPADGAKLLAALNANGNGDASTSTNARTSTYTNVRSGSGAKWLRIRVTDMATNRQKVSVNLPISLVGVGTRIAAKFAPEVESLEVNQIIEAIKSGAQGKIIDVSDDEDGEHVEIFVE